MRHDPSAEARLAALRNRSAELARDEEQLLERLSRLREEKVRTNDSILNVERSLSGSHGLPEAALRRTVRELGTFTVSELAAELGCSKPTAKKKLDAMLEGEMVKPAGRFAGKQVYEYVKPTEAGAAFEAQRRVVGLGTLVVTPERPAGVERPHDIRQSKLGSIRDKDIRDVAREAQALGWVLEHTGKSGHAFRLVRGADTVILPSTPRNSGAAADMLRQRLGLRGVRAKAS